LGEGVISLDKQTVP